jgi:predicted nuclease of predicted toxin-antitoxin system
VKLLLDENLSDRIVNKIIDLHPDSEHGIRIMALFGNTPRRMILPLFPKIMTFINVRLVYGHPPKFVYLRIGNSPTSKIVKILRDNFDTISQFGDRGSESILVLA